VLTSLAALPPAPSQVASATVVPQGQSAGIVRLQVGLGLAGRTGNPVPYYYSSVGASVEQRLAGPVSARAGGAIFPSAFNDWTLPFSGWSADLDLLLGSARDRQYQVFPYFGLGNRLTGSASDNPGRTATNYSLSALFGFRLPEGFTAELRVPLYRPEGTDLPANYEAMAGWWRPL
jgi:hypothetical protein